MKLEASYLGYCVYLWQSFSSKSGVFPAGFLLDLEIRWKHCLKGPRMIAIMKNNQKSLTNLKKIQSNLNKMTYLTYPQKLQPKEESPCFSLCLWRLWGTLKDLLHWLHGYKTNGLCFPSCLRSDDRSLNLEGDMY